MKQVERIIQFGEGGFLRGFFDWMLQKANDSGVYNGSAVVVQPIEKGMCDVLSAQGCRYHHVMRGAEGVETTEISVISRCIKPYDDWQGYLDLAKNPDFRFVVSNTTESGISYHPGDRLTDTPPSSFPAKVCALLWARFRMGLPGFVFLPCELIEENGTQLRKLILQYADDWKLGSDFTLWVKRENAFCNTLVDRIVTGYPKEAGEAELLGYPDDRLLDTSEYFHLWVIEGDRRYAAELPLDQIGLHVIWTDQLSLYRTRKVRILNGAHTALVPRAMLRGLETVRDCMENPEMNAYLRKCIYDEIIPTLDLPREDLISYADSVLLRFSNPYLKHYLSSIALNSVDKFRVRVMPSILTYRERFGKDPEALMEAFDALCEFYRTDMVNDAPETVEFIRAHTKEEIFAWMAG